MWRASVIQTAAPNAKLQSASDDAPVDAPAATSRDGEMQSGELRRRFTPTLVSYFDFRVALTLIIASNNATLPNTTPMLSPEARCSVVNARMKPAAAAIVGSPIPTMAQNVDGFRGLFMMGVGFW